ncbi:MAG: phospholipase A [Woeseiaceae bacterium]|nr:phospholipase A [Woeseiaceae bacterium]
MARKVETPSRSKRWVLLLLSAALSLNMASADEVGDCIVETVQKASESMTVGEVREQCMAKSVSIADSQAKPADNSSRSSAIERRFVSEFDTMDRPYTLTAHRPNYVLPYTYNSRPNNAPFDFLESGDVVKREEAKFQVSFKLPVTHDLLVPDSTLFFAYTNQSWWQLYNTEFSSAFRESDHEPELFVRHFGGPNFGSFRVAGWDLGFAHQSNGRPTQLSRSWNRVFANVALDAGDLSVSVKAWYRLPEDANTDDNPAIYQYLGYGEFRALYTPNRNTFGLMLRQGTEEGAVELTWSYPLSSFLRLYASYFNGYGESLLDYDHHLERIGIGVALNDYLQR